MHTQPHQDILCWHFGAQQLQDPELVSKLVQRIAVACDLRGDNTYLQLVVVELMNNALDHGVLKLESALKSEANGFTQYYNDRGRRLSDLRAGWIEVTMEVTSNKTLCIRVLDSGNGFDYRTYRSSQTLNPGECKQATVAAGHAETLNQAATFGRGLTILNDVCDVVAHVGCGNEVVVEMALESLQRKPKGRVQKRLPGIENV